MERNSTHFLRLALLTANAIVALLCILVLPSIYKNWAIEIPDYGYLRYPAIIGLGVAAVLFFVVTLQAFKLLGYIDANKAFSQKAVYSLKKIKYLALCMGVVFMSMMPLVFLLAEADDAPGLIIFGFVFSMTPFAVAVFAALCQRILQNAIDFKKELDLTV